MEEEKHTDNKVTDLAYLTELSKGDDDFLKEMIRTFVAENPAELLMLEQGIANKDLVMTHVAAHKLRSTAPFVGIDRHIMIDITEIESLSSGGSATKKIEIQADNKDIQKIEIITTNPEVITRISTLYVKIKTICEKAREELLAPGS